MTKIYSKDLRIGKALAAKRCYCSLTKKQQVKNGTLNGDKKIQSYTIKGPADGFIQVCH